MNPFWRIVTVGHNTTVIVYNWRLTEREEMVKQQSEGDVQCNPLCRGRAQSNLPPWWLWRLWQSAYPSRAPIHLNGFLFSWCTANTEYCIHRILNNPKIDCLPLAASISALSGPCCAQFVQFPQCWINPWTEPQLPSHMPSHLLPPNPLRSDWMPPDWLPPDWLPPA